jgi:hypothetical protein
VLARHRKVQGKMTERQLHFCLTIRTHQRKRVDGNQEIVWLRAHRAWIQTRLFQIESPAATKVVTLQEAGRRMSLEKEMLIQMKSIRDEPKETQVDHVEINRRQWRMNSARGDRHITIFEDKNIDASNAQICLIELVADFYDRSKQIEKASIVPDILVTLKQVVVNRDALSELHNKLSAWLQNRTGFTIVLSPNSSQNTRVNITLGIDSRWICSVDKPVFCLQYKDGGSLVIEASFVVDQSCIKQWLLPD